MKTSTYKLLITAILFLGASRLQAQDYKWAAGLKFGGYENGISGKYFIDNATALQGLIGFRDHGVVFTGLYENNHTAFEVPELKFYYGFGAHIGSAGQGIYRTFNGSDRFYERPQLLLGLDGVVGLEYQIPETPIAVSVDLNPRIEVAKGPFLDLAPGLGIKYTFK
ncbi:hypothetical protein [Mucilaginibacter antarcticus]|uniref:DUF3575 domain-containing protein n=1 Tax=Mucilaginibacter antarcticus TaxID=1855725 RepID=A0ABW5XN95_9SPHI